MLFEISYSHPDYDDNDELTDAFIDSLEVQLDYFNAKVSKVAYSNMPAGVIYREIVQPRKTNESTNTSNTTSGASNGR